MKVKCIKIYYLNIPKLTCNLTYGLLFICVYCNNTQDNNKWAALV